MTDDNIVYERAFGQELSSENSILQMYNVLNCEDDFSSIENESNFAAAQQVDTNDVEMEENDAETIISRTTRETLATAIFAEEIKRDNF